MTHVKYSTDYANLAAKKYLVVVLSTVESLHSRVPVRNKLGENKALAATRKAKRSSRRMGKIPYDVHRPYFGNLASVTAYGLRADVCAIGK